MNNFLSNLPTLVARKKKRLGRGLGSGKSKAGRGITRHQKGRESIPLHFEGGQARLVKRFPLLRGKGINKPFKKKPLIIDFSVLNQFKDGETVTVDTLIEKGLISDKAKVFGVKLLNKGKLQKKLIIKIPCSRTGKKIVEKMGSSVVS